MIANEFGDVEFVTENSVTAINEKLANVPYRKQKTAIYSFERQRSFEKKLIENRKKKK